MITDPCLYKYKNISNFRKRALNGEDSGYSRQVHQSAPSVGAVQWDCGYQGATRRGDHRTVLRNTNYELGDKKTKMQ